jgi:purine-binding chemotaxis protein CheW
MSAQEAAKGQHIASETHQFLTFALGQEEYGVEILKIQEIKGFSQVTPLPNAPAYVKGVLNLRGTIVPIVDLRKKFRLPDVAYTQFTVIVVVQVQGKTLGFVVDAVSDVLTVPGHAIQPTPDLHGQIDTACLTGLAPAGEQGEKLVILLDIDKVLKTAEAVEVAAAAEVTSRN